MELMTSDELPAEIDLWLMSLGFYEPTRSPGSKSHAPIYKPKVIEEYVAWKPTSIDDQPPF